MHKFCVSCCLRLSSLRLEVMHWYVSNVSIIFYCSMLILYQCHMFLLLYYIIFRHFIGQTYWQDARCQFLFFWCMFCISENPLEENSSELEENLRRIFLRHDVAGDQRATWGATQGPGVTMARDQGPTHGWDPPLPLGHLLSPSDDYKITINLKKSKWLLFFTKPVPKPPPSQTLIWEGSEADPDTLPEGRSIPECSSSPCLPPGWFVSSSTLDYGSMVVASW